MIDWTRYRRTQTETPDSHKPVSTKPGTVYINPIYLRPRRKRSKYNIPYGNRKPKRWIVECELTENGYRMRFNEDVVRQAAERMVQSQERMRTFMALVRRLREGR